MLEPYQQILTLPGAWKFSLTGLVARMPISMVSLGIVLLVSARAGSYGLAGTIAATAVVAGAVGSPLQGHLTDRFGQSRVLPVFAAAFALGIVLLLVSIDAGWPVAVPHLFAALVGVFQPKVGSMVRARWSHLIADRPRLQTAFALEAVLDEVIWVTGPIIVTFLATLVDPAAGLACAALTGIVGSLLLAAQHGTQPPAAATRGGPDPRRLPWRPLVPLVLVSVGVGGVFGALDVVTVAFASEADARSLTGVLLAAFAAGSMTAGVVLGAVSPRVAPLTQLRVLTAFLALAFVPLTLVPPSASGAFVLAAVLLFVCGIAIAPSLVASVSLVERAVPRERLTEGIAWTISGIAAGGAPGAAVSGWAVDAYGARASYLVCVLSAAAATVVAWAMRRRR